MSCEIYHLFFFDKYKNSRFVVNLFLNLDFLSLSSYFLWLSSCWNMFSLGNSSPTWLSHHPTSMDNETRSRSWICRTLWNTMMEMP